MSTNERYGTLVWNGLLCVTMNPSNVTRGWVTVGEVAIASGVSKPTSKKYLWALEQMGKVKSMKIGNTVGYAVTSGMED